MTTLGESESSSSTLLPGEVLASTYRVIRRLAVGGMAEVYLCGHIRLPGFFVAKVLTRDFQSCAEGVVRFRREAELLASLRHPNIVQVFDFNVSERGQPFLVMEYLEGVELSTQLQPNHPMSRLQVVDIVRQVAAALHSAHAKGIVHRDLKPENIILLNAPGQHAFVKVIDFGISLSPAKRRITSGEVLMGTPHFMSPEQAQGKREEVDHRSDQFSMAAMAYLMLTGKLAFDGDEPLSVLYNVVHTPPAPLPAHLGPEVDAVLRKAMAKQKADRFESMLAFSSALEAAVFDSACPVDGDNNMTSVPAVHASADTEAAPLLLRAENRRKPKRRWARLGAAAALIATLAATGAFTLERHEFSLAPLTGTLVLRTQQVAIWLSQLW